MKYLVTIQEKTDTRGRQIEVLTDSPADAAKRAHDYALKNHGYGGAGSYIKVSQDGKMVADFKVEADGSIQAQ